MVLNREQLNKFAQPVVDVYNKIEMELLENLVKGLKGKTELLDSDPEKWRLQLMENLGIVDERNLQIIKRNLNIGSNELNRILLSAGLEGLQLSEERAEKALKKGAHLVKPEPITSSPVIFEILQGFTNQAISTLNMTNQSLLSNAKQAYIDILNQASVRVATGVDSGESAVRRTIREWANSGIPVLKDAAGRNRGVEGYVRMVMVTSTNNAVNAVEDQRFDQWGIEYTEISSHAGARPKCAPYQGKVFALKKERATREYSYIGETSMGDAAGLFGINCGHHKYPFVPGITEKTYSPYDEKENARIYKNSQRQRAIERSIRQAKTREKMLIAAGDEEGAKKASQLVNARFETMRKFIKETGRKRRRYREQIVLGSQAPSVPKVKIPKQFQSPSDAKPEPKGPKVVDPALPKITPEVGDIVTFQMNDLELFGEVKEVGKGKVIINRTDDIETDEVSKRVRIDLIQIKDVTKKVDEKPEPPKPIEIKEEEKEDKSKSVQVGNDEIKIGDTVTAHAFDDVDEVELVIKGPVIGIEDGLLKVEDETTEMFFFISPSDLIEDVKKEIRSNESSNNEINIDDFKFVSAKGKKDLQIYGELLAQERKVKDRKAYDSYVSTSNSFRINKFLYSGRYKEVDKIDEFERSAEDDVLFTQANNFSDYIKKHTIPRNMRVVRYADLNFFKAIMNEFALDYKSTGSTKELVNLLNKNIIGSVYKNEAFTSVSYDRKKNVFTNKPVEMEFLIEEGTTGLVTSNHVESEIVLDRGTEVRFLNISFEEGRIKVLAKVLKK